MESGTTSFLVLVGDVAVLAGAIASLSGFGPEPLSRRVGGAGARLSVPAALRRLRHFLPAALRVKCLDYALAHLAGRVAWNRPMAGVCSHAGAVKSSVSAEAT
jgi:hypothetical protein